MPDPLYLSTVKFFTELLNFSQSTIKIKLYFFLNTCFSRENKLISRLVLICSTIFSVIGPVTRSALLQSEQQCALTRTHRWPAKPWFMLMSCHYTPTSPYTRESEQRVLNRNNMKQNDFDVTVNFSQREYIKNIYIYFGEKRLQSKCILYSPNRLLSVKYYSFKILFSYSGQFVKKTLQSDLDYCHESVLTKEILINLHFQHIRYDSCVD